MALSASESIQSWRKNAQMSRAESPEVARVIQLLRCFTRGDDPALSKCACPVFSGILGTPRTWDPVNTRDTAATLGYIKGLVIGFPMVAWPLLKSLPRIHVI